MSRYSDAIAIPGGACNPIAVMNLIVRGIEEIRAEVGGISPPTDLILQDPALSLMVHQPTSLSRTHDCIDQIGTEYFELMAACDKQIPGCNVYPPTRMFDVDSDQLIR